MFFKQWKQSSPFYQSVQKPLLASLAACLLVFLVVVVAVSKLISVVGFVGDKAVEKYINEFLVAKQELLPWFQQKDHYFYIKSENKQSLFSIQFYTIESSFYIDFKQK